MHLSFLAGTHGNGFQYTWDWWESPEQMHIEKIKLKVKEVYKFSDNTINDT